MPLPAGPLATKLRSAGLIAATKDWPSVPSGAKPTVAESFSASLTLDGRTTVPLRVAPFCEEPHPVKAKTQKARAETKKQLRVCNMNAILRKRNRQHGERKHFRHNNNT